MLWKMNSGVILMAILMCSCSKDNPVAAENYGVVNPDTDLESPDMTDATHGKLEVPNFDEVFDNTVVKRFDIVVTKERWQSMLDNMTELYGAFGERANGTGTQPTPGGRPTPGSRPEPGAGPDGPGGGPGGGSPGGVAGESVEDPIYVPADLLYQNKRWYHVGIRFKGNSSLRTSWESGTLKLSLKLNFDKFEDDYPEIENQRFYGFKKLSLKNNYDDKSCLREKVAADIFARAGLAVSHTAFYTLYIDHGDGPIYFGLYTLVEEVDNTLIKTQFSSNDGNLYKPENIGASFAAGAFSEADFEKKTNEDANDWSDIKNLFSVLHDSTRTINPKSWRANLDPLFDTDGFLRYLAVNTVIQNWDTYGLMTHNYYLYNNPDNNKLTWIPWDNNEALQEGKQGGSLELNFSDLQQGRWPLIEYMVADSQYRAAYDDFVQETIKGAFEINAIQEIYTRYAKLVEPYVTSELSGYTFLKNSAEFQQAIDDLNQHVTTRAAAVAAYLDKAK